VNLALWLGLLSTEVSPNTLAIICFIKDWQLFAFLKNLGLRLAYTPTQSLQTSLCMLGSF
jgi:hypothetical protein